VKLLTDSKTDGQRPGKHKLFGGSKKSAFLTRNKKCTYKSSHSAMYRHPQHNDHDKNTSGSCLAIQAKYILK